MAFVVEFDATNNILRITFDGHLTDSVAFDCFETATRCAASHPRFRGIVDLSRVTKYDVSAAAVTQLARISPSPSPAADTLVIVAPKEDAYGMSRMFQLRSESTHPNQHVVRTMDEAYKVLGVESPTFGPP